VIKQVYECIAFFILWAILWPAEKAGQGLAWVGRGIKSFGRTGLNAVLWLPRKIRAGWKRYRNPCQEAHFDFFTQAETAEELTPQERIAALITDEGEIPNARSFICYGVPSTWAPGKGFDTDGSKIQVKSWTHGPAGYGGKRRQVKNNWAERLRIGQVRVEKKDKKS